MNPIDVIFREEADRWIKGDRHVRPWIRKLMRRKARNLSGMQTVVNNFLVGLKRKGIEYTLNRSGLRLRNANKVISFGMGLNGVVGLDRTKPVIAAIGFPYPWDAPHLCEQFNVRAFLQHSRWALDVVKSAGLYPAPVFDIWPAGIDTDLWTPTVEAKAKRIDVLVYDKIYWDRERNERELLAPIREFLRRNGHSFSEVRYGQYTAEGYRVALSEARCMIFLSAHETQGLAYQECLSTDVPVMAWDRGLWLDPARFRYGLDRVAATSVPYFDGRCGEKFTDYADFESKFGDFHAGVRTDRFRPREFILDELTIEKSTDRLLDIYRNA